MSEDYEKPGPTEENEKPSASLKVESRLVSKEVLEQAYKEFIGAIEAELKRRGLTVDRGNPASRSAYFFLKKGQEDLGALNLEKTDSTEPREDGIRISAGVKGDQNPFLSTTGYMPVTRQTFPIVLDWAISSLSEKNAAPPREIGLWMSDVPEASKSKDFELRKKGLLIQVERVSKSLEKIRDAAATRQGLTDMERTGTLQRINIIDLNIQRVREQLEGRWPLSHYGEDYFSGVNDMQNRTKKDSLETMVSMRFDSLAKAISSEAIDLFDTKLDQERKIQELQSVIKQFLHDCGFEEILPTVDSKLNKREHNQARQSVRTSDTSKFLRVAKIIKRGFSENGEPVERAEVAIYVPN